MMPPSKSRGASAVIQKASCSKPVGSSETQCPFSPAFCIRSTIDSAILSASNGLPLNFSVASCALKLSTVTLGDLLRAAQKHQERRGNFAVQRDYDHVPFVDHLERLGNPGLRETANHSQDRQSSRWAASEIDGQAARPSPRERTSQSTFHSFGKRRGAE